MIKDNVVAERYKRNKRILGPGQRPSNVIKKRTVPLWNI